MHKQGDEWGKWTFWNVNEQDFIDMKVLFLIIQEISSAAIVKVSFTDSTGSKKSQTPNTYFQIITFKAVQEVKTLQNTVSMIYWLMILGTVRFNGNTNLYN